MDMHTAFEQEMQRLREWGEELARAHPEQARMLSLHDPHDRDPYVERLLEGVAFLTAGVRQEVARSAEQLHEELLHTLAPELAEPWPAATVLALRPPAGYAAPIPLPAGKVVAFARPETSGAGRIPFALPAGGSIEPVHVARARWEPVSARASRLTLSLRLPHGGRLPAALPLFADLPPSLGLELRAALIHGLQQAHARCDEREQDHLVTGLRASPLWWPSPAAESGAPGCDALARLQGFLLAPTLFHFVVLRGLDQLEAIRTSGEVLLSLDLEWPAPSGAPGSEQLLRANCFPAFNLQRGEGAPVALDREAPPYTVRVDGDDGHCVVHRVQGAWARDAASGRSRSFAPVWMPAAAADGSDGFRFYRRATGGGEAVMLELGEHLPESGTLSTELRYSQGALPRLTLARGDVDAAAEDLPEGVEVANLARPTPFRPALTGRVSAHTLLRLVRSELPRSVDTEALRSLLSALGHSDRPISRPVSAALQHLACRTATRARSGVVELGLETEVVLDLTRLESRGEALLLGELIHGLLLEWAPIDRYVAMRLVLEPDGEVIQWQDERNRSPTA